MHKKLQSLKQKQGGFTLIELLVVIGILAILLAITLFALNPTLHFQNARNAQRQSDVTAILDSIYEYEASNSGNAPAALASVTTATPLGAFAAVTATATSFSSPNLTYTVPAGNTVTSGQVNVTGCSQSGDNTSGTPFTVLSGTNTTITVNDPGGSATSATGCSITAVRVDLCPVVVPTFIANIPMDPSGSNGTVCTATYNSGYTIAKANGRFTVAAPSAENGATISVTR